MKFPSNQLSSIESEFSQRSAKRKRGGFTHGLESCNDCYFDFDVVNRVAWLKFSGNNVDYSLLDQVNDSHYAFFKIPDDEEEIKNGLWSAMVWVVTNSTAL